MIDTISDRTYFVIDEAEYDAFIADLFAYGIASADERRELCGEFWLS